MTAEGSAPLPAWRRLAEDRMARKIILDVDPGIDDAVALCLALGDPSLDVVAVTATGGNVSPDQATDNVQAIIEQLDPPRWPRLGTASSEQIAASGWAGTCSAANGLCGAHFAVVAAAPSPLVRQGHLRRSPSGAGRCDDRGHRAAVEYCGRPAARPTWRRSSGT